MSAYRKGVPYRKPRSYRGLDVVAGVSLAGPQHAQANATGWDRAVPMAGDVRALWRQSVARGALLDAPFDALAPHAGVLAVRVHDLAAHGDGLDVPSTDSDGHHARAFAAPVAGMALGSESRAMPWADIDDPHSAVAALAYASPAAQASARMLAWRERAAAAVSASAFWRAVVARGGLVALPWGPIAARQAGTRIDWPVEPNPQPGVITIPQLPVYVMLPTLSAVRLPDRTPIPLLGITVQGDLGSWAWTFSAPMAAEGAALIEANGGDPTEIEVTINGFVWTFVAEAVDDNRRFGTRAVTVRGRSRSAELAQPYAPGRTYTADADTLAAQLATNELVDTGWTLVWDAPDWLIPGGTFSYQDLAPIDAIAQVASAIGAAVLSDPAAKVIRVAPTYEASPWAWGSTVPYAILPASILTQGDSSWEGGTNADGVYVYAENAATGALVKLAGTSGATQLPMIVERLAVHADAQRERGRNELGAAGKKRRVNRTYPLFPTPAPAGQPDLGVIPLGALLEIADTDETWRGQVMGVRIDAQRSGSALSVRQHLTLERQYR